MRNPLRIPGIIDRLEEIWAENPDLRLGQLILNAESGPYKLYNIEDEQLIEKIENLYENKVKNC